MRRRPRCVQYRLANHWYRRLLSWPQFWAIEILHNSWVWFILCFWILFPMELCLHLEETLQTSLHVLPDRRRKCSSTSWRL